MLGLEHKKRHTESSTRLVKRGFVFLVLGAFVLANFPIPMPMHLLGIANHVLQFTGNQTASPEGESEDEHGIPFPCQHGRCGCSTARKCWTECCCHTPAERLKWAQRRGVKPPSYAVLSDTKKTTKPASCCSTKVSKAAVKTRDSTSDSCCKTSTSTKVSKPKERAVLSILACKCRGSSSVFTTLSWFLDPERCILQGPFEYKNPSLVVFDLCWETIAHRPPSPPPKVG